VSIVLGRLHKRSRKTVHRSRGWEHLRYGPLLDFAARGRRQGDLYAGLVAALEYSRDRQRRDIAEGRILRWLGVSPASARSIYRAALRSEALEEADSARFMRGSTDLSEAFFLHGDLSRAGRPRIYGVLHFGSPVLGYLALRLKAEPHLRVIARELDETNPMSAPKRAFGRRKVAWVERTAGALFLDTDSTAVLHAREHLLTGNPLYAAVDVPGDVVTRADRFDVCGSSMLLASGIFRLASMTGADVQMLVPLRQGPHISVHCRPPIQAANANELGAAVVSEMEIVLREHPGEWWFWPLAVP
jgi:hypothetical protein